MPAFTENEANTILRPFVDQGLIECLDMDETRQLCAKLRDLKLSQNWTDAMADEFQTLILSRSELSGVQDVFMNHPFFRKLMKMSDGQSEGKMDIYGITRSYTFNPNFDVKMNGQILNANQNDNNVDFGRKPKVLIYDDEEVEDGKKDFLKKTFQVCDSTNITDPEQIELEALSTDSHGILYALNMIIKPFVDIEMTSKFDLLRSFLSNHDGMILISVVSNIDKAVWVKEIPIRKGVWINFSEKMLPCNPDYFPVRLTFEKDGEASDVDIAIRGVMLSRRLKKQLESHIKSDTFQPYDYGFCQDF